MTTRVIRDQDGFITTGKFCLFGLSKSKSKQVTCENATTDLLFSLAINTSKLTDLTELEIEEMMEELTSTGTITHAGGISPFPDLDLLEGVRLSDIEGWDYDQLPEGFTLAYGMLTTIMNMATTSQTFKFKFTDKFKGLAMFVTPEQRNQSIVNNGIELSFCLSPNNMEQ